MNLSGAERKRLRDGLISAFPNWSLLEQLLDFKLNKKLNLITQDTNLKTVVYQLILTAEAEGWLIDLVQAASEENSGNLQLKEIAQEILPTFDVSTKSSYVSVLKPSIQHRKILVSGATVIIFGLVAGGAIATIAATLITAYAMLNKREFSPSTPVKSSRLQVLSTNTQGINTSTVRVSREILAESLGYIKNSSEVALSKTRFNSNIVDKKMEAHKNWALESNTEISTVKDFILQHLEEARAEIAKLDTEQSCEAFGYMKNGKLVLVDGKIEPREGHVNWCKDRLKEHNWNSVVDSMDNNIVEPIKNKLLSY